MNGPFYFLLYFKSLILIALSYQESVFLKIAMDDCVLFCAISNGLSLWIGSGKSDDDSKVSPEKKGAFECMHIYEHPLFLLEKCLLSCHMFYIVELSIHQCSHSMRFLQIRESKKLKFVGFEMKNNFL